MRLGFIVVVAITFCSQLSWAELSYRDERSLGELRAHHRVGEDAYLKHKEELRNNGGKKDESVEQRVRQRIEEFKKSTERICHNVLPSLPETVTGTSMMWKSRARGAPPAVDSAAQFNCGPGKCITPFNGEFGEADADFSFSERGGLSFAFIRRYASYSEYDCGFGKGWYHDFNAGIVFDAEDILNAQSCVVFWQGKDIRFEKKSQAWVPEHGYFFLMEIVEDKVFLFTPLLTRIEFEPAAEKQKGISRWRLSGIASRHDKWKANRIELAYLNDCDRLQSITGVRGERIDFAYDAVGHVVGINSRHKAVRYEYNGDLLAKVSCSPVTLSAQSGSGCNPVISYEYVNAGGSQKICRKQLSGQSYWLEMSYDERGRVVGCGYVSADARQMYQLTYGSNETIVEMPKPSAKLHYFWGGTSHASLPCRLEIPAQKAGVRYAFNEDYLPTEETNALGVKTVHVYDVGNPNPIMRGNLLMVRQQAGGGAPIKWREFGVRTSYEREIALPIKIESYQVETNGVEEVVKLETLKYRAGDFSLTEKRETGGAERGGIVTRFVYNRYGEIGLERDANDNVTIYEYAGNLPSRIDYDFVDGSVTNGGLIVRKVEDANAGQIKFASRALATSLIRNEVKRVKPCALETRYAWDCDGNQIRGKRGFHESLKLYNEKGAVLAGFDNGTGLSLTEYLPDGRAKRVLNEFCPDEHGGYVGHQVFFFAGRYCETAFEYDSLGQMVSRRMTDEEIGGLAPKDTFLRYSNGKIAQIVNPSGVTRVDSYDNESGLLVSQSVKGMNENIPLGRIIERFPGGSVRVFEDKLGAVWTNRLDSFGRPCETISCLGTTKREVRDSLGRVIETCESDAEKIYSQSKMSYSREYGLIESEKKWKSSDGKKGVWIETLRHLYDAAGNEISTRGAHKKSWSYALYDGLGRRVATMDPAEDCAVVIYDADCEAYSCSVSKGDDNEKKEFRQGCMRILDGAGRTREAIPVDSNGKLVRVRSTVNTYNLIGQVVKTESMGLSSRESKYNSLGWVVRETTSPANAKQGERTIVISTTFRADGKTIRRELGNTALALFGDKDNVRPEHVDAPQTTRYYYDEYGRLQKTENPDGLTVTSTFNKQSFPSQMIWTHHSSTDVLRKIEFAYSPLGQVQKLVEGKTKSVLQEFSYDGLGRLTRAVDLNGGERVVLESKYDTCGQKIEDQTILSGRTFPARRFDYDPVEGVAHASWSGTMSGVFWSNETTRMDAFGRLKSITLDADHEPAVEWEYMGRLPLRRSVKPSAIDMEYAYTPLGEILHQRMRDGFTEVGRIEYAYGQQGQMLYSSTRLKSVDSAGDYQFASYSYFDDYRRLTGQNAEFAIPEKDDWRKEWERVFGISERSLSNQDTLRMRYDQANNIWVRYQGEEFNGDADKFNQIQSPAFISAAKPFPNGVPPDKRELASNREVSKATFGEDGLAADVREYDLLGNLVEFKGQYWDGVQQHPVKWVLEYDPLGRLSQMEARSEDDDEYAVVKKGEVVGRLGFAYDAENRRVVKRVVDRPTGKATTNITYTVYNGTRQGLVYVKEDDKLKLIEEYLWGVGERELVMATLTRAEKDVGCWPTRYWFQQDHGFNTILVTRCENGHRIPVSASSYLGFGENATMARIADMRSSMDLRNKECAYNNLKDELLPAAWTSDLKPHQFIELRLCDLRKLSTITIWGAKGLPDDFLVYVLPVGADSPNEDSFDLNQWHHKNRSNLAAIVKDGYCQGYQRQDSYYSPYKVALGDRRGDRIVIAWEQEPDRKEGEIKEIEILCAPDNPSAIAFAGQWLDRETGMYYQINRYRIAGSDKFISPDPLGFVAGINLYAYANGNPLEWHDPDGRSLSWLAAAGIGAGIGAVIGGGVYALQCWISGDEFSWKEFGIQVAIGAVAGFIAGATFGIGLPAAAGFWTTVGVGAAAGAAGGATQGILNGVLHGESITDSLYDGLKGAVVGGVAGAVGGGVVKGLSMPKNLSFFGHKVSSGVRGFVTAGASGFSAGGAGGAAGGLLDGLETGDYSGVGKDALNGALVGAFSGLAVHGALAGYEHARGITWDKNRASYWKEEARLNPDKWSPENLARMRQGCAPQRINPITGKVESMELHHSGIPRRAGLSRLLTDQRGNLKQVWPDEHRAIDPFRK